MHHLGALPSKQVWMSERCCHRFMSAHIGGSAADFKANVP